MWFGVLDFLVGRCVIQDNDFIEFQFFCEIIKVFLIYLLVIED